MQMDATDFAPGEEGFVALVAGSVGILVKFASTGDEAVCCWL